MGLFLLTNCASKKKDVPQFEESGTICVSNLASFGDSVRVTPNKKGLKGECTYLGKVTVPYCHHQSKAERKIYHSNILRNLVGKLKGDVLYSKNLSGPNRKGNVVGHGFQCKNPPKDLKKKRTWSRPKSNYERN